MVCIDRYSLRRSCSCWSARLFRRSMAAAMRPAVGMGLVEATAGLMAVTWAAATLSAGAAPAQALRRVHPRAALLLVLQSLLAGSTVALIILASVYDFE